MYAYQVQEWIIGHGEHRVYGKLYRPERDDACPAIILSHGYNGCHEDFDRECRFYAEHGCMAYALDFCGGSARSRSSGKSTDMTLLTEKADLLAVFDHISTMAGVDPSRVYLMGGSQGGLVTALAAEERADKVRGVILYFPAVGIPDNWRSRYPSVEDIPEVTEFWGLTLGRVFFESMHELSGYEAIGGYRGDVLIITGDQDMIVPLDSVRRTVSRYAHAELTVLPGEGHGFTPEGNKTAMEMTLAMMER